MDVSHCSEQVGWDAMEVSTSPVIISHACSSSVCYHDRGKSDEFVKAIADQGGFIGVVTIPGFLQETTEATLDDVAHHVEHLVNVMGIEHVGIGTDKAGPGPGTDSMVEWPEGMVDDRLAARPGEFNFSGFRLEEHRLTDDYHIVGYNDFTDWPNITVKLAERGRHAPDTGPQLPEGLPRRGGVGARLLEPGRLGEELEAPGTGFPQTTFRVIPLVGRVCPPRGGSVLAEGRNSIGLLSSSGAPRTSRSQTLPASSALAVEPAAAPGRIGSL